MQQVGLEPGVAQRAGRKRQAQAGDIGRLAHAEGDHEPQCAECRAASEHQGQPALLIEHAAQDAAQPGTEELTGGVDPHGGALATCRRHLADQRRQRRLKQIEGDEEGNHAHHQHPQAVAEPPEEQLAQQQRTDGTEQHAAHLALLLAIDDERNHAEEADQQRSQVDPPMLVLGQCALLHQRQRQRDEARHENRV